MLHVRMSATKITEKDKHTVQEVFNIKRCHICGVGVLSLFLSLSCVCMCVFIL